MEFTIEFFDYGRFGVTAKEPRTGLVAEGDTKEEAREEIGAKLKDYMQGNWIPPFEGPDRSFLTIDVEIEEHERVA